jgi:hypothetical protein
VNKLLGGQKTTMFPRYVPATDFGYIWEHLKTYAPIATEAENMLLSCCRNWYLKKCIAYENFKKVYVFSDFFVFYTSFALHDWSGFACLKGGS